MHYLSDNFIKTGKTLKDLAKDAEYIDTHTNVKEVEPDGISLLYCYSQTCDNYNNILKFQTIYDGALYPDENGDFDYIEKNTYHIPKANLTRDEVDLLRELKENSLVNFDGNYKDLASNYMVSNEATTSLANKLCVKGSLLKNDSYTKAIIMATAFSDIDSCTIIYKTEGMFKKIMAFVGTHYKMRSMSELSNIANIANKYFRFTGYKIDNTSNNIDFIYGDYIIRMRTSNNATFADSITVHLNKEVEYKLLHYEMKSISDYDVFFKQVIDKLDNMEDTIQSIMKYDKVREALLKTLGNKTSKIALTYLGNGNNLKEELFDIGNKLKLSNNQQKEFRNVFYYMIEEAKCS